VSQTEMSMRHTAVMNPHDTPAELHPAMFTSGCSQPEPTVIARLGDGLAAFADRTAEEGPWRSGSFRLLASHGLLAGFVPVECGGTEADETALLGALAAVAERCLTTALAVSQWASAVRILAGGPEEVRSARLPALARGEAPTTVGLSQLTTSRRHLGQPALRATPDADGSWRLDGVCPWVTGADASATIVTGAATPDDTPLFFVVPTDAAGLVIEPPLEMLALSGTRTSVVRFTAVRPADVIRVATGPRAGGLATTALALGAARGATRLIHAEARARPDLGVVASRLDRDAATIAAHMAAASATPQANTAAASATPQANTAAAGGRDSLRAEATSLALRAAQAALTSAKGAGFVRGHPAERLARESLLFLVWSCPQSVATSLLCDFAGVD
jgi:butyryl-CoA dehydrogenase